MAFEFRGMDSRGVPLYVGGEEPPSPLVCAALLLCGAAILFLFLACGLLGIEEGEPGRMVAAVACGLPVFLLLMCGYRGWMRVSLALPFLRPNPERTPISQEPEMNLDGEDLFDPRKLDAKHNLLRPAPSGAQALRPAGFSAQRPETLLRPSHPRHEPRKGPIVTPGEE